MRHNLFGVFIRARAAAACLMILAPASAFLAACGHDKSDSSRVTQAVERWQSALRNPREDICDLMPAYNPPSNLQGVRERAKAAGRSCEDQILKDQGLSRAELLGPTRITDLNPGKGAIVDVGPAIDPSSGRHVPVYLAVTTFYGGGWTVGQVNWQS
jgi:hypothetical protein